MIGVDEYSLGHFGFEVFIRVLGKTALRQDWTVQLSQACNLKLSANLDHWENLRSSKPVLSWTHGCGQKLLLLPCMYLYMQLHQVLCLPTTVWSMSSNTGLVLPGGE